MSRLNHSTTYQYALENEVSHLLSHFESDFVLDIVDQNLNSKVRADILPMVNLCSSYETTFQVLMADYPVEQQQILQVRDLTYREIIDKICRYYNFGYIGDRSFVDLYAPARYIYEFFISNFQYSLVNFMVSLIVSERDNLLEHIKVSHPDLFAINPKSTPPKSIVNKRLEVDTRYTILSAAINTVINILATYDISFDRIVNSLYLPAESNILLSAVQELDSFYRDYIIGSLTSPIDGPILISNIRMQLMSLSNKLVDIPEEEV